MPKFNDDELRVCAFLDGILIYKKSDNTEVFKVRLEDRTFQSAIGAIVQEKPSKYLLGDDGSLDDMFTIAWIKENVNLA